MYCLSPGYPSSLLANFHWNDQANLALFEPAYCSSPRQIKDLIAMKRKCKIRKLRDTKLARGSKQNTALKHLACAVPRTLPAMWVDLDEVPPPVQTRAQTLPLEKLSWDNFERLCYRLCCKSNDVIDAHIYGVQGQSQAGIDILARVSDSGKYATWQCKRYKKYGPSDVKKAVDKFLSHEWAKSCSVFCLATSASLSDTKVIKQIETQALRCKDVGIDFIVLDGVRMSTLLKNHADLVDDFFDRPWVVRLCGREAAQLLCERKLSKEKRLAARKKLAEMYRAHFNIVDLGLPSAAGHLQDASPCLSLQQRYILPTVNSLKTVISDRDSPEQPSSSDGALPTTTELGDEKPVPGFHVSTYRNRRNLIDWVASGHRCLILGGPGIGKSAALRFITLDLLSDSPSNEIIAKKWGRSLPIFVPFAMLTRLIANGQIGSVSDFLQKWLELLGATADVVKLLKEALDDERLLLVIDGLDEWTDQTPANSARVMVLDFIRQRNLPALASARHLGYERLGTLGPDWSKAELRPFEEAEQRLFTKVWFNHFHNAKAQQNTTQTTVQSIAETETDLFMAEIASDSDLSEVAGIPLLLSALIYLRLLGRVLPNNKFDALAEITRALINDQPQRRNAAALQGVSLSNQNQQILERGLEFLALLIHQKPDSESIDAGEARTALSSFYEGDEFRKSRETALDIAARQLHVSPNEVGIIVERPSNQIAFLYRSIQEFLAAKEISRWAFSKSKEFLISRCAAPGWQDVILGVLHLSPRRNEVDEILKAISQATVDPLESPLRQILLARSIFSSIKCSPDFAEEEAKKIILTIERSAWMPLRVSLLMEVARGIASESVGSLVQSKMLSWFPGSKRWRMGLFSALAKNPSPEVCSLLLTALFNTESHPETKEIAESIALGAESWPNLADELVEILYKPADTELQTCILHALCSGWPNLAKLPTILSEACSSRANALRFLAFVHRSRRGEKGRDIKAAISEFCRRGSRHYPWEDLLVDTLSTQWSDDPDFRDLALAAARNGHVPAMWDEKISFSFLVRAFPNDDQVANLIARKFTEGGAAYGAIDYRGDWEFVFKNFKGHSNIIAAAEQFVASQAIAGFSDPDICQAALLARTEKCKKLLLTRLKGGKLAPQWTVGTLIELCGSDNQELREIFLRYSAGVKSAGSVANFLPDFIEDKNECRRILLNLLKSETSFSWHHVLQGLKKMGLLHDSQVLEIIEKKLDEGNGSKLWLSSGEYLVEFYPENPRVKRIALELLKTANPPLDLIASTYVRDETIRPVLNQMASQLHEDLRLTLVQTLGGFSFGERAFTQSLLARYDCEWSPEVRTLTAHLYHSHVQRVEGNREPYIEKLCDELQNVGFGYDESQQAAVAGLLAMNEVEKVVGWIFRKGGQPRPVRTDAHGGTNWPFVEIVAAAWRKILELVGDKAWTGLGRLEILIWQLELIGHRELALRLPQNLVDQMKDWARTDRDAFRAFCVIRKGSQELKDFCFEIFENLRRSNKSSLAKWGHRDINIWFEAAQYLAENYSNDADVLARLEDISRNSFNPTGPVIALCRSWPSSPVLTELWVSTRHLVPSSQPSDAWLVSVKSDLREFVQYLVDLPKRIIEDQYWRFPQETLRAVRRRLESDSDAQTELLTRVGFNADNDVLASVAGLVGMAVRDKKALIVWANRMFQQKKAGLLPAMGWDVLSGDFRPVEFCLLEACLTTQHQN